VPSRSLRCVPSKLGITALRRTTWRAVELMITCRGRFFPSVS
jgi:hypothetical protein